MLPSKGYFRSIDCPFYANNLCHRFYCHFRHIKKDEAFSTDLDLINISICEDESVQDFLNTDVLESKVDTCDNMLPQNVSTFCGSMSPQVHSIESVKDFTSDEPLSKTRTYLLPKNIPKYNPTPISKLKTRHKHVIDDMELSTGVLEHSDVVSTPENSKEKNIVQTLACYFVENNATPKDDSGSKDCNLISSTNVCNIKEKVTTTLCSQSIPDTTCIENSKGVDKLELPNIDSIIQENLKLKEMVSQLQNKTDKEELNKKKELLDNKTLLMDLMGFNELKANENSKNTKAGDVRKENINIPKNHESKFKNHCKKYRSERRPAELVSKKRSNNFMKSRRQMKPGRVCSKKVKECYDILSENNKVKNEETHSGSDLEPDVIIISDSEEIDNTTERPKDNDTNRVQPCFSKFVIDNIPEPKQKIRISHVKENTTTTRNLAVTRSNQLQVHRVMHKGNVKEDGPDVKKKPRLAHSLNYNTLSIQSVHDHLTHWQKVRDRVQRKCINPNSEEGYQNWAQVKISPVPNVRNMITSKNLLYSKIKQWKSKVNTN